ncbi:MAG: c-type cytochrome [Oceanicaulis sp.]
MGDLFFNKVAGAILAIFLIVLGLQTLGHGLYDAESPETPAYPIDLSVLDAAGGGGEAEEEGPVDFGLLLASADVSAGERVARRCASCHTFEEGGADGTGPHLWGVMGREVAEVSGFNYSQAMQDYASGGVEWLYQNMYDYLESPRQYVPGTAMSFAGLRDQQDRINIIAYMRSLSNDPIALPEPLPAEETAAAEAEGEAAEGDAVAEAGEGEAAEGEGPAETETEGEAPFEPVGEDEQGEDEQPAEQDEDEGFEPIGDEPQQEG